jgi:two-component system LytT family sensor kinase
MLGKKTNEGLWTTIAVQVAALLLWRLLNLVIWLIKFSNSFTIEHMLKFQIGTFFTGAMMVIPLSIFFSHYSKKKHVLPLQILVICLATLVVTVLWSIAQYSLEIRLGLMSDANVTSIRYYFIRIAGNILTMLTMSVIFYFMRYLRELRIQKEKTLKAETLAREAELQMLRYQLNPHFLFNALNSVRSLIEEDKKLAWAMVTELSEFLRYSLISNDKKEVPLAREVDAVRNYFEIQAIRFEERINTSIQVAPEAEKVLVPCFLIHPLVENSIKFGMQTSPLPLKITLTAEVKKNKLIITVTNTGRLETSEASKLKNSPNGTGTGLKNIRRRLELLHHGPHSFEIFQRAGLVIAQIIIKNIKGYCADD